MNIVLENEKIRVSIVQKGAELCSLQAIATGIEYIWQGDPAFWASHAPILFPFIGQSRNKSYQYEGKTYPMTNHGFSRDYEFTVVEKKADSVSFLFTDSEQTRLVYPFQFRFILTYQLAKSSLKMIFRVENSDAAKPLYFSLGAHPAFNVPIVPGTSFEDYRLSFSPREERRMMKLKDMQDFLIDLAATSAEPTQEDIPLRHQLFKKGLVAYETNGATSCTIHSASTPRSLSVSYEKMPYLCVWSPPDKDAPFICLEPWCGLPDTTDASGELTERLGGQMLAAAGVFETSLTISIT